MKENKESGLGLIKSIFLAASEGIIISDNQGSISSVNPKGAQLFGYSVEDMEKLKIEDLIPKNVAHSHHKLRNKYFKDPNPRPMGTGRDLNGLRKDGSVFPLEISLSHFIEQGQPFVVAFVIDISQRKELEVKKEEYTKRLQAEVASRTEELQKLNEGLVVEIQERKSAEVALRKSEDLYKHLATNYPNGTINVLDHDLKYLITGGVRILDHKAINPDQLIGTSYLDQLPNSKRKLLKAYLNNGLNGTSSSCEYEYEGKVVIMHTVPLLDDAHSVDKLLVVEENITEQKKAQEEIQKSLSKERELNELKSRFVSMASHEFRTPLATILSSTNLLERYTESIKSDKTEKHLNRIKSNVDGLTNILNDFLSLEKLEAGGIRVEKGIHDIIAFFHELIEETTPLLKKGQYFQFIEALQDPIFNTDKKILKNILLNLISNASKYSDEGKSITISLLREGTLLHMEIKDEGIGIPLREKKRMFEQFFRAENASNIQGTGLGLFIVKKYVELLCGTISLESEEGIGTTIKVSIPHE